MRTPDEINDDIKILNDELKQSYKHYLNISDIEKLRIPSNLKRHFKGRDYFNDEMEKLVWEEDD